MTVENHIQYVSKKEPQKCIISIHRKIGKGVKIMNNEELIRDELKDYGVEDNLFDLALYYAAELARYVVFSSSRYRNPGVPEAIYNRENQLDPYIEKLTFIYDTLDSLSDETVEFLRNTSKMTERYGIQNSANHRLLNIQKQLDTIMTKCVPCRNIEYEKVRLGEDSDQYRRLLYLRKIVDENEFLPNEYLNRLIDILNHKEKLSNINGVRKKNIQKNITSFKLITYQKEILNI